MSDDKDSIKEHQNGVDGVKASDPTESDPCIEEKTKRNVFWDKTRQKLSDKSGLSHKGLYYVGGLLLALFVLVIIVIALGACWPRTPHHQRFPVCRSDACLRASAQIQEYLNRSVPQCDDVWNWACGNFLAKNKLPPGRSKWNQRQRIMQEEATRIRELISTLPLPLHTGTVEWKLKHFYEACVEVDNVNMDEARPLTTIISELGGWSILRDWNLWDFEYKNILKQLHVKYGVTPYFKISVVPNPRIPGNSSIAISPAGLGLPDRSYYYAPQNDTIIAAYKQLIRDVVINLSAPIADALTSGHDIFFYEQRIAEITPESSDLLDPVNTYNPIKLSELKLTASSLPLHDILTAMFPTANIDDDTEIIVTSPDYLLKVSEVISSTDRKNLNSYMIWMLVKEYLPYLSTRFTSAYHAFYSELLGISQPYQRWEFCANLVQKFMPIAVDTLLERASPVEEASRRILNSTFITIRNVVKRRLKKYNSVPLLYTRLEKKLLNMKLQIGLPLDTHNDTILKAYYNKLIVLKANLFESYKNGILFLRKAAESRLMENRDTDYIIQYAVEKPFEIRYSPSTNTVVVPRAVLSTPNFENRYPKSIIYGRLGVDVANAVVSSVLPFASAWTGEGKLLTSFHQSINDSSRLIRHSRQCLTNFAADNKLAAIARANLTSLHSFIYLSSLNIANEALHSSLENDNHVHQPSLETYEDSALLYLSHIQSYCSISTRQQDFYDNLIRFQLSEKSLLKLAWSQDQAMRESLDCDARTENVCSDIF